MREGFVSGEFDNNVWNRPVIQGDLAGVVLHVNILADTLASVLQKIEKSTDLDFTDEKENIEIVTKEFSRAFKSLTGYRGNSDGD